MKQSLGLIFVALFAIAPVTVTANDGILGKWITKDGKSHVVISNCNAGLCGKIVWLKEPNYPADDDKGMVGKTKFDRENPDSALRDRPILGLEILRGFKTNKGNVWEDGTIYDPKKGKTYKSNLTLSDPKTLNVRGYIGFSWIGRTSVWTR